MKLSHEYLRRTIKHRRTLAGLDVIFSHHGARVGQLSVRQHDRDRWCVVAVDVDHDWQKMGIGTMLYTRAKEVLPRYGCVELSGRIEGAGVVSIREAVFGPGATRYLCGEEAVGPEVARQIVEQDYQRVIAQTTICLRTPSTPSLEWISAEKIDTQLQFVKW